jgi:hypothetical protein
MEKRKGLKIKSIITSVFFIALIFSEEIQDTNNTNQQWLKKTKIKKFRKSGSSGRSRNGYCFSTRNSGTTAES